SLHTPTTVFVSLMDMSSISLSSIFHFPSSVHRNIYTLSLHDALPILLPNHAPLMVAEQYGTLANIHGDRIDLGLGRGRCGRRGRSEEHTSELQSRFDLVCRLLLEIKKRRSIVVKFIEISMSLAHVSRT